MMWVQRTFERGIPPPTFKNEHFPKPSPTHPKCHLGAFHGVENNFLDFVVDEILGLQLVLDFYQTWYEVWSLNIARTLYK